MSTLGRYRLLFRIAAGGMAEVWAACASGEGGFQRLVAIKRMSPALVQEEELVRMFLDEARVSANIDSPHVVRTIDVGRSEDGPWLAMDLVTGITVSRLCAAARAAGEELPVAAALEVLAQAACGLADAHEARAPDGRPLELVHRDVSPQNLLVDGTGRVRVTDFGVARATQRLALTEAPRMKGKWAYASPEQATGGGVDQRSDLFSLGVVGWEMLSGRRLFSRTDFATPERLDELVPEALCTERPEVPPEIAEILARAMHADPTERWPSAREMSGALRAAAHSAGIDASADVLRDVVQRVAGAEVERLVTRIQEEMRSEEIAVPTVVERPRHNLRTYGTSFVGREGDLEALHGLIASGSRLVTVLGPGGVGKTRLTVELGRQLASQGAAVCFCDLTEARSAAGICYAVAAALGVRLAEGSEDETVVGQLAEALERRKSLYLFLDNFEQVVSHAATTVGRWLESAGSVRFVVTSQARLHLAAEVLYDLEPLTVPGEDERSAAVKLFIDRARDVRRKFSDDARTVRTIAEIVRRLDGLPLAIELAASRMRTIDPERLLVELDERFRVLARPAADVPSRQVTLEATIRWSWDLLDDAEREALSRCAVFHGGFDAEAAAAVLGEQGAALLDQLVDKSLVRVFDATEPGSGLRFGLYESVREFARRELERAGALDETMARHVASYVDLAERSAKACIGDDSARAIATLEIELENLLAAYRWAAAHAPSDAALAVRIALALEPLLASVGPTDLYRRLFSSAVALDVPDARLDVSLRVRMRLGLASALVRVGKLDEASERVSEAQDLATEPSLSAWVRHAWAELHWAVGRLGDVVTECDQALALAGDDARLIAHATARRGWARVLLGDSEAAARDLRDAMALARDLGDRPLECRLLYLRADLAADVGRTNEAIDLYGRCIALSRAIKDRALEPACTGSLGIMIADQGRFDESRRLLEEAVARTRETGNLRIEGLWLGYLGLVIEQSASLELARRTYEDGVAASARGKNRLSEGLVQAWLGRVQAKLGDGDASERALDEAASILEEIGDRVRWEVAYLCRGHLELLRASEAEAAGRSDEARDLRHAAMQRVRRSDESAASRSHDVRAARKNLSREIEALGEVDEPSEPSAAPGDPAEGLVVHRNERWFRVGEGAPVSLRKREALWVLLEQLADRRLDRPSEAFTIEALFEVGWPEEHADPRSAATRVYVAMSTLRGLGLRDALVRRADGYLLDPSVPVRFAAMRGA